MKKAQKGYFGLVFIGTCSILLVLSVIALIMNIYCLVTDNCKETCTCTIETQNKWND